MLLDAIEKYGKPEILNSDQGCQYTSALWTQYLEEQEIKTSMDGKGRALDNVWIERFWKSLKHDYLYISIQPMMVLNFMKAFKTTSPTTTGRSIILPDKVPMTDIASP